MIVHICNPLITKRIEKDDGERYCFICRKKKKFKLISMFADWYGWAYEIRCEKGHYDGDVGFGRVRSWEVEG